MRASDPHSWMWSEALDLLAQAERMHRQAFGPRRSDTRTPCWEPPVDVLETEDETIVIAAMPGVDPATVRVEIDGVAMTLFGERTLPVQVRNATIHRMEVPQGCFRRRVAIPAGNYEGIERTMSNGCLIIVLRKAGRVR